MMRRKWITVSRIVICTLLFLGPIFTHSDAKAQAETKLTASDADAKDLFGISIALSETTLLVGSFQEDSGCNSDPFCESGAAYTFTYEPGVGWGNEIKLLAVDRQKGDNFGWAVDIDDETIAIGAPSDDDLGQNSGSVYLFRKDPVFGWLQDEELKASDAAPFTSYGYSVSLRGDYLIVGAPYDSGIALNSGAFYVFRKDASQGWIELTKVTASDAQASDLFGHAVDTDGEKIIVGSPGDDDFATNSGAVYIYDIDQLGLGPETAKLAGPGLISFGRSVSIDGDQAIAGSATVMGIGSSFILVNDPTAGWQFKKRIDGSEITEDDEYGISVSIDGNYALSGAYLDDGAFVNTGSAYLFYNDPTLGWIEHDVLVPSDPEFSGKFGFRVLMAGRLAVVSAVTDDSQKGADTGSVYIYDLALFPATLIAPEDGATDVVFGETLRWSEPPGSQAYTVQIAKDVFFTDSVIEYSSIAETELQLPTLLGSTRYFWRVRSADNFGEGDWSQPFQFVTTAKLPPTLLVPENGKFDVVLGEVLRWTESPGMVTYSLQIAKDNLFTDDLVEFTGITLNEFPRPALAGTTTYFWRVRADDSLEQGVWSASFQFVTALNVGVGMSDEVPSEYALKQNYPNPFNPVTTISYDIPVTSHVKLGPS